MRNRNYKPKTLPVEPLLAHVEARGGMLAITQDGSALRWFRDIKAHKRTGWRNADDFCCTVLNEHPALIYGEIWWETA